MSRSIQRRKRKTPQNTIRYECKHCGGMKSKKIESNLRILIVCKKCHLVLKDEYK